MADGADKSLGAEVILFPGRFRPPVDDAERLDRAIRSLNQANAELRDNISGWRNTTNVLTASLGEVAESLQILDTSLMAASSQPKSFG